MFKNNLFFYTFKYSLLLFLSIIYVECSADQNTNVPVSHLSVASSPATDTNTTNHPTESTTGSSNSAVNKTDNNNASAIQDADSEQTVYEKINALRAQNKLKEAKQLGKKQLAEYPDDLDAMLLMGLIAYQESNYKLAKDYFEKILAKKPDYVDAKLGLIRLNIAQKQFPQAGKLLSEVEKEKSDNKEIKSVRTLYNKALQASIDEKKNLEKKQAEKKKKAKKISSIKNDKCPTVAERFFKLHLYSQAACQAKRVLWIHPKDKTAKGVLTEINQIKPHDAFGLNEIGISSTNDYVSDLKDVWDYSTIYAMTQTPIGNLYGRVNYAVRLQERATQEEINFIPIITPNVYLDLSAAYANNPVLFPAYAVSGEGYVSIPKFLDFSLGGYYAYIIRTAAYRRYTASISKTVDKWWFSVRANHYIPRIGATSTLFMGDVRRYFTTFDSYVSLRIGLGKSPDLADLESLDFLIIRNRFVNLSLQVPVFCHQGLLSLGINIQNWRYPSGLVRNLYGANIGINYRF